MEAEILKCEEMYLSIRRFLVPTSTQRVVILLGVV